VEASGGPRPAPGTLTRLFFDAAERFNKPDALQYKANGRWISISHAEVIERVRHVSLGLRALGIAEGDRVALLSENRPEWAITDYACLTDRVIDVPIYPTLPPEQLPQILNDSGSRAIFVSTALQAAKVAQVRAQIPALQTVISFASPAPPGADLTLDDLIARGAAVDSAAATEGWRKRALAAKPDEVATLIYTSGTTGAPKGVMLTHDNLHSNVAACRTKIPFLGDDIELSFLPLAHVFQRMFDFLAWSTGTTIIYAESIDAIAANIAEVRPTIVCAVPRLYEKMYARVLENAQRSGGVKRMLFGWARGVADRWSDAKLGGRSPGPFLDAEYALARRLVFSKVHARMGGRLRFFISGSAALAPEINKFFYGAGIPILEGYGLTETSPVIAVNTPTHFRIGTVGHLIDGVDVRIAEDGEIIAKSPGVMKGYYNNPKATSETIDADGWFHTGDIGTIEDGFLRITDRKKDLIKTSGGKYLAPQPIENRVKLNAFVAEAVLIGEGRKFPSLLIVPAFDQLETWAKAQGLSWADHAELTRLAPVQAKFEAEMQSAYQGLAKFETPKKIALLDREFSVERGELTPSLKVKRKVVDAHYKAIIDALYAEQPA
jgi:long-chain acyl-CoA synthetase